MTSDVALEMGYGMRNIDMQTAYPTPDNLKEEALPPESTEQEIAEKVRDRRLEQPSMRNIARSASDDRVDTMGKELSLREQLEVTRLKELDRKARDNQKVYVQAGDGVVVGNPTYKYTRGPDGRSYVVQSDIKISIKDGKTPEENLRNAEDAMRVAMAPPDISSEDMKVAAEAVTMAARARAEIARQLQQAENQAAGSMLNSVDNKDSKAILLSGLGFLGAAGQLVSVSA